MGVLEKYLGNPTVMKIIDLLLEKDEDLSKKDIVERCSISKGSLFKHWKKIEEMKLVSITRKFGKTKLYKIDKSNPIVQRLMEIRLKLLEISQPPQTPPSV